MVDSEHTSPYQDMLEAWRAFQERFPVIPTAYSLDGRRFSFNAPLGLDLGPGRYVRLQPRGSQAFIAQVLESEVERLESTEVSIDNAGDQGIAVPGMALGEARLRLRRNGLRGSGIILGLIGNDSKGQPGPFDDASIQVATAHEVEDLFRSWSQARPTVTIGSVMLPDGVMPGTIEPGGFNRHTFLCGQSGSGKTYSLGVVLEQLLLHTDLRIAILDPNADFVHLNVLRDPEHAGDIERRYLERANALHVYRSGATEGGEQPLRIHFSDLSATDQAMVLQLDPLANREEYHAFRKAARSFGEQTYGVDDLRRVLSEELSDASHDVTLRLANLGIDDWDVWAAPEESSLADLLTVRWRAADLDVSRFANPIERSVVSLAMVRHFWRLRETRNPVLIVVDEAHNICPAVPENAVQQAATDLLVTIAAEGRKYGLYLLISTQRPDKIHPNVLSQCDNLMLMRMNSQADLDDLATVFSFVPKGMLDKAATFQQGEALFAGKIVPAPRMMRVGGRYSAEGGADIPTTWAG
ncbi:MAG: ATP-binding protein [Thermomicrobiales bacterium]